jgi:hypothetical protein
MSPVIPSDFRSAGVNAVPLLVNGLSKTGLPAKWTAKYSSPVRGSVCTDHIMSSYVVVASASGQRPKEI